MTEYEPRKELIEKLLPVQLTDAELLAMADKAGHTAAKRDGLEADLDAIKKDYKAQIDKASAEVSQLLNQVRTKRKYVDISVTRIWDVKLNTVRETRDDTGEVVSERAMSRSEVEHERELLQEKLFEESPESDHGRVVVWMRDHADGFAVPVGEISKALGLSEEACSKICKTLAQNGLIEAHESTSGRGKNKKSFFHYCMPGGSGGEE